MPHIPSRIVSCRLPEAVLARLAQEAALRGIKPRALIRRILAGSVGLPELADGNPAGSPGHAVPNSRAKADAGSEQVDCKL